MFVTRVYQQIDTNRLNVLVTQCGLLNRIALLQQWQWDSFERCMLQQVAANRHRHTTIEQMLVTVHVTMENKVSAGVFDSSVSGILDSFILGIISRNPSICTLLLYCFIHN